MMNMKNYTSVSHPTKFRLVNSLFRAALTLFVALVISSCEFWQQPVRGYFEEWTSEVSIVKFEVDGVESYYDKDGNLCIPSGNQNVPLTLFLINPHHYNYITDYSEELPKLDTTNRVITADANDTTLLHLTYSNSYLKDHDGKSGDNGEIGTTINYRHPVNKTSKSYTFSLRCNSKPPKITDGAVMVNTNNGSSTYCLCFNLPLPQQPIHSDLKKIIINDGSSSSTINCHVESSGAIVLDDAGNLSTTAPTGTLSSVAGGASFRPNTNHLYYSSGIAPEDGKEQAFTITLEDEAGLSTSTVISTSSRQIRIPVVKDAVNNTDISNSGTNTLQLNSEYNAQVKVIAPSQLSNGESVSGVTVKYTLSPSTPTAEQILNDNGIIELTDTGTYQLKIQAEKEGYLSSSEITYTIVVPPLKVTFNANGGTITTTTQDVPKNTSTSLKSANDLGLSRTGYTLQGWSSTSNGSVAYTDGASVTLVSDITLYAIWQANKYNVTFNANEGKFSDNNTSKTMEETYDCYYVLPSANPTRKGYTFKGWYTVQSETGGNPVTSSTRCTTDSNHIVYARWEANKYTVTFDANGGKFSDNTLTKNKQETFDSKYTLPANPLRNGYTFEGWYTVSTTTGGSQVTSNTKCTTDSNHTVYARWKARKYNVTFDANGGYFSGSSTTSTIEETYDVNYVLPSSNPTKTGYTFAGWYTSSSGGTKVTTSDKFQITGTQTLYAHWNLNYWDISHSEYDSSNNTSGGGTVTIAGTKLDGKYGYDTVVTVNFIAESGKGLYEFTVKDSSNNAISLMSKTESGRTVTIKFKMPDSVVYINSRFKNAFTVKITPYTCTGDGDPDYVKESCANKTVRLWIANNGTVYDDSSLYYKDVSLDSNASFNGTICLPGTYTLSEFSNAKICAITTTIATDDTLCNCFGYKSVASNNANITLGIFLFGTSLSGKKTNIKPFQPTNGTWHELGDSFPTGIGFKYIWYNYTTGYRTSVSTSTEHTWTNDELTSGGNVVYGIVTVAGIESDANTAKTITK